MQPPLSTTTLFEVKDCKRAHVSNSIHVNSELPEEVYDLVAAIRQTKPENEWGNNDAENLFEEDHDLQLIESGKFPLDFVAVKSVLPVIWHVVGVLNDLTQCVFGLEHKILLRDRSIYKSPQATKHPKIEKGRLVVGDFETQEVVGIPNGD
jgi:hypothetical protein